MLGHDKLQNRIAEKLQPLIVEVAAMRLMSQAWVSKRLREEERIPELVPDAFFERIHLKAVYVV